MPGRPNLVARLFWIAVVGGGLGLVYGRWMLAATAAAMGLAVLHRLRRPARFRRLVQRLARRHGPTLAQRRRQECFVDAYGNEVRDGWERERAYFVERTLVPALEAKGYGDCVEPRFVEMLDLVEAAADAAEPAEESEAPGDGIAYERFCRSRLEAAGWQARPTPASGDQGADILAEREGFRLVVQCKRYGRPVGNAAVQEASAAARYWGGDAAAVVSNAGFTPAARKLAAATGVHLLHHDDLAELDELPASARVRRAAR